MGREKRREGTCRDKGILSERYNGALKHMKNLWPQQDQNGKKKTILSIFQICKKYFKIISSVSGFDETGILITAGCGKDVPCIYKAVWKK